MYRMYPFRYLQLNIMSNSMYLIISFLLSSSLRSFLHPRSQIRQLLSTASLNPTVNMLHSLWQSFTHGIIITGIVGFTFSLFFSLSILWYIAFIWICSLTSFSPATYYPSRFCHFFTSSILTLSCLLCCLLCFLIQCSIFPMFSCIMFSMTISLAHSLCSIPSNRIRLWDGYAPISDMSSCSGLCILFWMFFRSCAVVVIQNSMSCKISFFYCIKCLRS